jgi:hypothetical protein
MSAITDKIVREFDTNTRYTRDINMSYSDYIILLILSYLLIIHLIKQKEEKLNENYEKLEELYNIQKDQLQYSNKKLEEEENKNKFLQDKLKEEKEKNDSLQERLRQRHTQDLLSEDLDSRIDNSNPQTEELPTRKDTGSKLTPNEVTEKFHSRGLRALPRVSPSAMGETHVGYWIANGSASGRALYKGPRGGICYYNNIGKRYNVKKDHHSVKLYAL